MQKKVKKVKKSSEKTFYFEHACRIFVIVKKVRLFGPKFEKETFGYMDFRRCAFKLKQESVHRRLMALEWEYRC